VGSDCGSESAVVIVPHFRSMLHYQNYKHAYKMFVLSTFVTSSRLRISIHLKHTEDDVAYPDYKRFGSCHNLGIDIKSSITFLLYHATTAHINSQYDNGDCPL
jgi:hypothetical protein